MKKQFVTYEIAKKLKELKFNIPCIAHYHENSRTLFNVKNKFSDVFTTIKNGRIIVSAPLWQQVIDWLREVKSIHIELQYSRCKNDTDIEWWFYIYPNYPTGGRIKYFPEEIGDGLKYNEALEAGILKALELIKQKTKKSRYEIKLKNARGK